jgi:hypothetical protein
MRCCKCHLSGGFVFIDPHVRTSHLTPSLPSPPPPLPSQHSGEGADDGSYGIPNTDRSVYPEDGYCASGPSSSKTFLLVMCGFCLLVCIFTSVSYWRTAYQLYMVGALSFNPSGVILMFECLAATFLCFSYVIYMIEIPGGIVNPTYKALDNVRPLLFGLFAAFHGCAIVSKVRVAASFSLSLSNPLLLSSSHATLAQVEVSQVWRVVWEKTQKHGSAKASGKKRFSKMKVVVWFLRISLLIIVTGGTTIGGAYTTYAIAYASLFFIVTAVVYLKVGRRLANLLAPDDASSPGAASAQAASDQITKTANTLASCNLGFIIGLGTYSVTVQRPQTGVLPFVFVNIAFMLGLVTMNRILGYCRFGSRKKLMKGGFGLFRGSVMSVSNVGGGGSVSSAGGGESTVEDKAATTNCGR